jgi:hypothetical protein
VSDYFGALIRSSSLAVGASGSPPDRGVRLQPNARNVGDAPAVSSDIIEIHEERTAPIVGQDPRRFATGPPTAPSTDRDATPARQPDGAPLAVNRSAAMSTASASEESIPGPVRRDPDPVRLAMQWVAADPASRIIGAQPSIGDAAPRGESPRPREPVVFSEPPQVITERVTSEALRRDRANEPLREHPTTTTVLTNPPARAVSEHVERAAPASRIELPHEEVVEISIGAINLHVEAPAPQTIVQTASPAHPQRAPETHVARSGLSRRYLRSF